MIRMRWVVALAAAGALVVPAGVTAQESLPLEIEAPLVQLDVAKPFFSEDGFGFATGVVDATAVFPVGAGRTAFFTRLTLSRGTLDGVDGSSTTFANPRVGVLLGGSSLTRGEIHVDLPLLKEGGDDDYATLIGVFTDPDRIERYFDEYISVGGSVTPVRELDSGARVGVRLGANIAIPTEDGPDTEALALVGAFASGVVGSARVGVDLGTVANLTTDGDFGKRTIWSATVSAAFEEIGGRPEIYARIPVDEDISDVVDFVLGVRVRMGG